MWVIWVARCLDGWAFGGVGQHYCGALEGGVADSGGCGRWVDVGDVADVDGVSGVDVVGESAG